jgi:peptidyl-tRNA hydrolase, PTH2 family
MNALVLAAILTAASISLGYHLGSRSARQHPPSIQSNNLDSPPVDYGNDSDDDEGVADGDLSAIQAGFLEPCKLVCLFNFASPKTH